MKQEFATGSFVIYQGQRGFVRSFNRNPNLPNRYNINVAGRMINDVLPCFLTSTVPTVLHQYEDKPEHILTTMSSSSSYSEAYADVADYLNS